ncbi:unnamed protein product [Coregonus sp. 'balchen']|nr:unnamed protein product [Coregonus sp. 'balchen']
MQDSHTSLQEGLRTGLSSGLSSEIAFTSSQDAASGIMGTFVKGVATIFQNTESTMWPTDSLLLENSGGVSETSTVASWGLTVKISEEKLWSMAKTICTNVQKKLKDFLTGLKPKIVVTIQSEISISERMNTSRELLQINNDVEGGREKSSKGHRSETELEINLPGTPIPDKVHDVMFPIVRSCIIDTREYTIPEMSINDMRKNMMSIVDTLMEAVHTEMAGQDSSPL